MNETKAELVLGFFFPNIFSNLSLPTSGGSCELFPLVPCIPCRSTAEVVPTLPIPSRSISPLSLEREICFPGATSGLRVQKVCELPLKTCVDQERVRR